MMKIRINGQTIRLRLNETEVKNLVKNRETTEMTDLPQNQKITWAIRAKENIVQFVSAESSYCLILPETQVKTWAMSSDNFISIEFNVPNRPALKITVEKDLG